MERPPVKTVVNSAQVAHLWANQSQPEARNAKGSLYFRGDTIYSYGSHFPIARHVTARGGRAVVLVTTKSYSVTTSGHTSSVRSAASHLPQCSVADVTQKPNRATLRGYRMRLAWSARNLAAMRSPSEWSIQCHVSIVREANQFAEFFGFKTRFVAPTDAELAALRVRVKAESVRKAAATRKRNEEQAKLDALTLADWLAGAMGEGAITAALRNGPVHLRLRGECVQTTKGASVPVAEAERCFRFAVARREKGWHRNGEQFAVGQFQLDAVNAEGIVAGCHRIGWAEIERFAAVMGWAKGGAQ